MLAIGSTWSLHTVKQQGGWLCSIRAPSIGDSQSTPWPITYALPDRESVAGIYDVYPADLLTIGASPVADCCCGDIRNSIPVPVTTRHDIPAELVVALSRMRLV
jgi:hypothetical protein